MTKFTSSLALCLTLLSASAHAKLFKNAYMSFELPDKWDCVIETTDWVCRSSNQQTAKEAIIILTAKERGPTDDMKQYETYLKGTKNITNRQGKAITSKVVSVRPRTVNGHTWIDALQLNSEVPDYYTRYMVTTKENLGMLITFSAHQLVYTKYSNDFYNAILSLRAYADKSMLAGGAGGGGMLQPGTELLGPGQMGALQDMGQDMPQEGSGKTHTTSIIALIILLGAIAAYIILKRTKPKPRSKK